MDYRSNSVKQADLKEPKKIGLDWITDFCVQYPYTKPGTRYKAEDLETKGKETKPKWDLTKLRDIGQFANRA
jgi:hypothetical protein